MQHFTFRECGYALGSLSLLAALYVGSYYTNVERMQLYNSTNDPPEFLATWPRYRVGEDSWAHDFYAPIHALDRQLRPGVWHAPENRAEIEFGSTHR
jgi:hypothetical protein